MIENETLSQQIADSIALKVVSGELKPGERLMESNLVDDFGTSRAPIREAFLILEKMGIVERIPRRGIYVKKYSKSEILEFYKVVYDMTRYAIEISKNNDNSMVIDTAMDYINDLERRVKSNDVNGSFMLIEKIHQSIFELANNRTLLNLYLTVNIQWTTFRYLTLSYPESLVNSWREYKSIFEFLQNEMYQEALNILKVKESRAVTIINKLSNESVDPE